MNRKLTSYKTTETLPQEFHRPQRKKREESTQRPPNIGTHRNHGFTSWRGFSFHLTGLTGSTEHQTLANNTSTSRRAKNKTGFREEAAERDRKSRNSYLSERARAIVSRNLWITRAKATARGLQEAEGVQQADREPAKAAASSQSSSPSVSDAQRRGQTRF